MKRRTFVQSAAAAVATMSLPNRTVFASPLRRRAHVRPDVEAVKNRYDPTNLFRMNANVRPTV